MSTIETFRALSGTKHNQAITLNSAWISWAVEASRIEVVRQLKFPNPARPVVWSGVRVLKNARRTWAEGVLLVNNLPSVRARSVVDVGYVSAGSQHPAAFYVTAFGAPTRDLRRPESTKDTSPLVEFRLRGRGRDHEQGNAAFELGLNLDVDQQPAVAAHFSE